MKINTPDFFCSSIRPQREETSTKQSSFSRNTHVIKQIGSNIFRDNEKLVYINAKRSRECRFMVASTQQLRERAYRLAYRTYREAGLVESNSLGMVISAYDSGPEIFTLLAEDEKGEDIGTVSLVFDSGKDMPCSDIFNEEILSLRQQDRKMAEVIRLVVKKDHPCARDVLWRFFNLTYIYALRVRHYTDFVVEVNPRHAPYYEKKLLFKTISEMRNCPRVQNAPAVLAQLDLVKTADELAQAARRKILGEKQTNRSLYPYACSKIEERFIAEHLYREYSVMTEGEKVWFGLGSEESRQKPEFSGQ